MFAVSNSSGGQLLKNCSASLISSCFVCISSQVTLPPTLAVAVHSLQDSSAMRAHNHRFLDRASTHRAHQPGVFAMPKPFDPGTETKQPLIHCLSPPNLRFVTATGNSSISLAHKQDPGPFNRSHRRGNPPIPSNRLAIVAGRS